MRNRYLQLIGPLVGSVVMAALLAYRAASDDNVVTGPELVLGVVQVLMVVAVWGAANVPGWEKGKKVQAMVFAVLGLLASLVTNGISGDEMLQLLVLGLSTLGVVAPPSVVTMPVHNATPRRAGE